MIIRRNAPQPPSNTLDERKASIWPWVAVLLAAALLVPSRTSTTDVDRWLYVYEKDKGTPPPAVIMALRDLGAEMVEADTVDGTGQVPERYRAALEAAQELPSLVGLSGGEVVRVVVNPTAEQVANAR